MQCIASTSLRFTSDLTDYTMLFLTFKSIFPLKSVTYNAGFLGTKVNAFTFGVDAKGLFAVLIKSDSYTFIKPKSTLLFFLDQATPPLDCLQQEVHFDHTSKGLPRWSGITMGCLKGPSNTGLQLKAPPDPSNLRHWLDGNSQSRGKNIKTQLSALGRLLYIQLILSALKTMESGSQSSYFCTLNLGLDFHKKPT